MLLVFFIVTKTLIYINAESYNVEDRKFELILVFGSVIVGLVAGHIVMQSHSISCILFGIVAGVSLGAIIFGLALCVL